MDARSGESKGLNKPVDLEAMQPDKGFDYNLGKDPMEGINKAIDARSSKASPLLVSTLKTKLSQDMKIIAIPGWETVESTVAELADRRPEWFPRGFKGIHAVSNSDLFAGVDLPAGKFYLSSAEELASGFSPARDLMGAMESIKAGTELSFHQEYAVETLWHEMTHGLLGISTSRSPIGLEPFQEGITQWVARNSYDRMLRAMGGQVRHHEAILRDGLAYPLVTANVAALLARAGMDGQEFVEWMMRESGAEWRFALASILAQRLGIGAGNIRYLMNKSEELGRADFIAKIGVQITNAQRNRGEP